MVRWRTRQISYVRPRQNFQTIFVVCSWDNFDLIGGAKSKNYIQFIYVSAVQEQRFVENQVS